MPLSKKQPRYTCPNGHGLNDDVPYCMICGESFVRVQPNNDALQSISSGIKGERDSTVSPVVQPIPNCPDGREKGI